MKLAVLSFEQNRSSKQSASCVRWGVYYRSLNARASRNVTL